MNRMSSILEKIKKYNKFNKYKIKQIKYKNVAWTFMTEKQIYKDLAWSLKL